MSQSNQVVCHSHGLQPETFVCQHIAQSLKTGQAVGFFWPAGSDEERPDAWCLACEERARVTDGDWIGEAAAHLGLSILCASCYDNAKAINFPNGYSPGAG